MWSTGLGKGRTTDAQGSPAPPRQPQRTDLGQNTARDQATSNHRQETASNRSRPGKRSASCAQHWLSFFLGSWLKMNKQPSPVLVRLTNRSKARTTTKAFERWRAADCLRKHNGTLKAKGIVHSKKAQGVHTTTKFEREGYQQDRSVFKDLSHFPPYFYFLSPHPFPSLLQPVNGERKGFPCCDKGPSTKRYNLCHRPNFQNLLPPVILSRLVWPSRP